VELAKIANSKIKQNREIQMILFKLFRSDQWIKKEKGNRDTTESMHHLVSSVYVAK
jgi:hypothetical protein